MSDLCIVRQASDITPPKNWQSAPCKKNIVSMITSDPADKRKFQVIAKYQLPYNLIDRIMNVVLALLGTLLTLGLGLIHPGLRRMFTDKIQESRTFAVPYGKVVVPYLPDPEEKKYPMESKKYISLAQKLDPSQIRKSLDKISDNSLNKIEIIKDMLLAILQNTSLPKDDNALEIMDNTCRTIEELLRYDINLNDNFIIVSSELRGDFKAASKQFSSFLDAALDSAKKDIDSPDEKDRVMAIYRPLIELLLANGAKTNLEIAEQDEGTPEEMERLQVVSAIRGEILINKTTEL